MLHSKVSAERAQASGSPASDPGRNQFVRCLMQVLWPAFIGAAMTVGLLFSVIDPVQIEWVSIHLNDNRAAAYTLAFLVFWLLFSLTCSLTWYLAITETPGGRPGRGKAGKSR